MSISIDDLKGFDFSDKYLNIHENFTIKENGKQIDYKIFKKERYGSIDEIWIEYKYLSNKKYIVRTTPYKNPFEIFREAEFDIQRLNNKFDGQTFLIKNLLEDFNGDFNDWEKLTEDLSSDTDLLKFFPNYESKIPLNLSKEDLFKYLDEFSKEDLENLFKDFSILDFVILTQNIWGEDYEYLIKKAFTIHLLGEEFFDFQIFNVINKKIENEYIHCILKEYGFDFDNPDLIISVINTIINDNYDNYLSYNIDKIKFNQRIKQENIDLNDASEENLRKIVELRNEISDSNNSNYNYESVDFNNLDNPLTKSKYIYVLKAISSSSKSSIVMRYKIPKEDRNDDSVQTIALNNGHIKYGNLEENTTYTVNQLKNVLKKYGLKITGNKPDLINRIKENLSDEIINEEFPKRNFILTKKGYEYLNNYSYLAEFYNVIPLNFTINEFDLICNSNPDINPDDIIECLVNEKWIIWDETLGREPNTNKNYNLKEKLQKIFAKRKSEDNYYKNFYDSIVLV